MSKILDFKVTVEFICKDMINEDELKKFNSDPLKAYKYISEDFGESVINFSDKEKVIKVEIIKKPARKVVK